MEESLKILKDIGAQKIHKDTHISKDYVQAIIHGSFEGLSSVQLIGFISILEREYGVDLSELTAKGRAYFEEIDEKSGEDHKVFVTPKKQKSNATMYVILGIILFASFAYYSFGYLSSMATTVEKVDNSNIEDAQSIAIESEKEEKKSELVAVVESTEANQTKEADVVEKEELVKDTNETTATEVKQVVVEEAEVVEEVKVDPKTLKILPKNKIWAGYINIKTNQKYQKVFRKEFAIDVAQDWLLLFGSGTVHLEINGKKQTFSSNQNMRFKYVDGKFTKITVTEFKKLNKGRKW